LGIEGQAVDVFRDSWSFKWFIRCGNAEIPMGWVVRGKQNIEQPTKLAFPNEADVADFYG
jgi:hypothetical protein